MICLAIGSNLPTADYGGARQNCEAAVRLLGDGPVSVLAGSPWYESAPVPVSAQPDYVNGVIRVATELAPLALLGACQEIETAFGRARPAEPNAARTLDIDIIDWDGVRLAGGDLEIPHPRLAERLFVLQPLQDIAPGWRHPVSGKAIAELLAELGTSQKIRRLA